MRLLITGASRGIGLEFTRQYAAAGHDVVATCRRPTAGDQLHRLAANPRITIRTLDVTDDADVARLAADLGNDGLDMLINNAGFYGRSSGALDDIDVADWQAMFGVNTIGPVRITAALRPVLRRGTNPKVIGLSSIKASIGRNHMGASYQYRATKAGLNAVLRSLAVDLAGDGICVVALSPGWVDQGEDVTGGLSFDDRLRKARRFMAEFGGPAARVSLEQSVRSMIATIDRLSIADSGVFLDHKGDPLPW